MSMALIWSAVVAFLVTNTDDLILLMLIWGIVRTARDRTIVIVGQYAGILSLVAASWLLSLGFMTVPTKWVGLLGLLPLTVGVVNLWKWFKRPHAVTEVTAEEANTVSAISGKLSVALVWSVTVGDGGDNLSVYIPFFVHQPLWRMVTIVFVFIVMTAFWLWLSNRLVQTKAIAHGIERFGTWLIPCLFIIIGLFIILSSGLF